MAVPLIVAMPAYGPFEDKHPFNIDQYGKVRGYNPIGTVKGKAVVLLTRNLDEGFFRMASALEEQVVNNGNISEGLVVIIDEKGAQQGGYTVEEFAQRREQINKLAKNNKINHLSFFIASSPAGAIASSPELKQNNMLLLVVSENARDKNRFAITRFLKTLDTVKIDDKAINDSVTSIKSEVARNEAMSK